MGTSAGGNMAYHVGLPVASAIDEFGPLKIKGLILHHPYFGGSQRTDRSDLMWDFTPPVGADRDHEYCNPTVVRDLRALCAEIARLGWEVILAACDRDPMIDRQVEVVKILRSRGVKVVDHVGEGNHGMDLIEASVATTVGTEGLCHSLCGELRHTYLASQRTCYYNNSAIMIAPPANF
ncbi:probable carboxylesterase 120 [Prosopis cineraria]|uniref:probable carboxylesterase 120 n=1 Tax=Prosopis cineraria TaxID=364024 RepID=UPI00240EEC41|nr:probable carboxylesterase 120 [Prosopis cineraria]